MRRIDAAVAMQHAGDREGASRLLGELWQEIGDTGDPLCRCRIAHHMADLQDDPVAELSWDLHALDAANLLTDADVKSQHSDLSLSTFYPSLHLNLAEDYRRVGDIVDARNHLDRAQILVAVLPNNGYGGTIRAAISRVAARIGESHQDVKTSVQSPNT